MPSNLRYLYKGAKLLLVGINPHPGSHARGIPFSNNKLFWYLLSDAGILVESREALRADDLLRKTYHARFGHGTGLGFVNIIDGRDSVTYNFLLKISATPPRRRRACGFRIPSS